VRGAPCGEETILAVPSHCEQDVPGLTDQAHSPNASLLRSGAIGGLSYEDRSRVRVRTALRTSQEEVPSINVSPVAEFNLRVH
jgi:hypothetical protein